MIGNPDPAIAELLGRLAPALDDGQPLVLPVGCGTLEHLVGWEELNRAVSFPWVHPPWIEVAHSGSLVPPLVYTDHIEAYFTVPGHDTLNARRLEKLLRDGATVSFNWLELLFPSMQRATQQVSAHFHVPVRSNLFLSGPGSAGSNVHWDSNDALVLQVHGQKRWKLWKPTRRAPLARDVAFSSGPAEGEEPSLDHLLEPGDVLFLPRGWWHHVSAPADSYSVHITMVLRRPVGDDLLRWLGDEMLASEQFRDDLPLTGGREERREHARALFAELRRRWAPDLVAEYLAHVSANAVRRSDLSLPHSIAPRNGRYGRDRQVVSAAPWPVPLVRDGDAVEVQALGRRWRLAPSAAPLLGAVLQGAAVPMADLGRYAADGADADALAGLVETLVEDGLLRLEPVAAPAVSAGYGSETP